MRVQVPCLLGSEPPQRVRVQEAIMGANPMSVNFDIGPEEEKELRAVLRENDVTKKLCLTTC